MASYRLEWRRSTKKDLRKLSQQDVAKIVTAVERLADEPRPEGSKKLRGSDRAYRIRIGDFRVIYEVFDGKLLIEVIRAGHRRDIYRK